MKILVVDDHVLIRQATHGMLRKIRRDAVVLEAPTADEALRMLSAETEIRLILLDLTLPDRDGFSVLAEMRREFPTVGVVVLSAVQDPLYVTRALGMGALGYIPKSSQAEIITNALRLVMSGGIYIPPEILSERHAGNQEQVAPLVPAKSELQAREFAELTERQLEVLALMMLGSSNKTICRLLNLAEPTVKNHVTAVLKALNVSNRTEAVVAANNLGWKPRMTVRS